MKKTFFKKCLAVSMSAVLSVGALTACGGDDSKSNNSTSGKSSGSSGEIDTSETLTLDVFDSLANYQGVQSGWFGKIVKDKFNLELNIIAPNVAGGGDTLFQTRSANGDLGDIIITNLDKSRLKDMVAAGLIYDMGEFMDKCPHLQEYKDAIESASALAEEDGTWAIPSSISKKSATDPANATEPTNAISLRWDIYKELGYPAMKNLDDLLTVLKDMQEKAGKSDSGKKVYAMSLFKDWDGNLMQNATGITALYGYQQKGFAQFKVDGSDIQSVIQDDGIYHTALKFFFDANQMGIVDPESTSQNYDTLAGKYKDGAVLYALWPWLGTGQYNTADHTSAGKGFQSAVMDEMKCLDYGCMPKGDVSTGIMIGSKCKDPARVAQFIDWLYSPEGVMAAETETGSTAGPEGLAWEMKDGKPVFTDFGVKVIVEGKGDEAVPAEWGEGTWRDGCGALNYKALGIVEDNPDIGASFNRERWEDYQNRIQTALSEDWKKHYGAEGTPIEYFTKEGKLLIQPGTYYATPDYSTDIATVAEQCKQVIVEYSWKMAFAKDQKEFDSLWNKMKETCNGLGFEQVYEVDKKNSEEHIATFKQS